MCNFTSQEDPDINPELCTLCDQSLIDTFDETLFGSSSGRIAHVIQIGAHTGFEANDPLAAGWSQYLKLLAPSDRQRFHWTFVEPSPPNYATLMKNIDNNRELCHMEGIEVGIVPDNSNSSGVQ